jgi:hypothetical protein
MKNITKIQEEQFKSYLTLFYGPEAICGHFFKNSLTENQIDKGIKIFDIYLSKVGKEFYGDTIDRELVRDIILNTEYKVPSTKLEYWTIPFIIRHLPMTPEIMVKHWISNRRAFGLKVSKKLRKEMETESLVFSEKFNKQFPPPQICRIKNNSLS